MKNKKSLPSKKIVTLSICAIIVFCLTPFAFAQSSVIVNAQASSSQPQVGSTLTITLTISNVENLAGIDATLQWASSILSLTNVNLNLGDSYSDGVLHGSKINYDPDTINVGDIFVDETRVSGSYNLLAQSIGQSTPGFTGSGTIATLSFNVISTGSAGLNLQTELADHPAIGEIADNINHQDTADSVTAIVSGSSNTPNPTPTPINSPSQFPSPTGNTIPTTKPDDDNFTIAYLPVIVGLVVAVIAVVAVVLLRKNK
jgi:hypothetical protein